MKFYIDAKDIKDILEAKEMPVTLWNMLIVHQAIIDGNIPQIINQTIDMIVEDCEDLLKKE